MITRQQLEVFIVEIDKDINNLSEKLKALQDQKRIAFDKLKSGSFCLGCGCCFDESPDSYHSEGYCDECY